LPRTHLGIRPQSRSHDNPAWQRPVGQCRFPPELHQTLVSGATNPPVPKAVGRSFSQDCQPSQSCGGAGGEVLPGGEAGGGGAGGHHLRSDTSPPHLRRPSGGAPNAAED